MFFSNLVYLIIALMTSQVLSRQITVRNNCPYKLWPGIFTGNKVNGVPDGIAAQGGWELGAGGISQFNVPNNWISGRIWGRTSCDFRKKDVEACSTGSCIGGLHCTQPGIPPVTLAEFTLVPGGQDNYDVSNVDGSNLPMAITANGCPTASCPKDLNRNCPIQLQQKDRLGRVVGCKSACTAFGGESNCCTGAHNTPATCPPSGVQFYHYFKNNCPDSYAYAYDEGSGTALKHCSIGASYTVTFCP